MTSNKITLAIFSSAGRQRLLVERTCRASALKSKIRDILNLAEDFKALRDNGKGRPGKEEIKLIGTTSIVSMGLKNGDVIHVFPLSGTRFQETEHEPQQNGVASSSTTSSNSKSTEVLKPAANLGKVNLAECLFAIIAV